MDTPTPNWSAAFVVMLLVYFIILLALSACAPSELGTSGIPRSLPPDLPPVFKDLGP